MGGPSLGCHEKPVITDILVAAELGYASAMDTLELYERECFMVFLDEFDLIGATETFLDIKDIEIGKGAYYDYPTVLAIPVCDHIIYVATGFTLDPKELHADAGRLDLEYLPGDLQAACMEEVETLLASLSPTDL